MRVVRHAEWVAAFLLCAAITSSAMGQAIKPRLRHSPLETAIRELASEAEQLLSTKQPPPEKPDFSSRYAGDPISLAYLQRAIITRTHADPFTDAYIRWQLTTLFSDWPALDEQSFRTLLFNAPPLLENPYANRETMTFFEQAAAAGPLMPKHLERVREATRRLESMHSLADVFNGPAHAFRAWILDQLAHNTTQQLAWRIENCSAAIDAGWSSRTAKARLTRAFTGAASDPTVTPQDRRFIEELLAMMIGHQRRFINTITFLADDSIKITYSTSGVTRQDVDRWLERFEPPQ
ncbi:MAG TPA: hypothetical protein PK400_06910 [Phycisphaerales bacterium]|nr:hypothetical protein [Phycisphaerales bacterium]HRQ74656.1 hypothetical protein [Phycisphaerales bacterium]